MRPLRGRSEYVGKLKTKATDNDERGEYIEVYIFRNYIEDKFDNEGYSLTYYYNNFSIFNYYPIKEDRDLDKAIDLMRKLVKAYKEIKRDNA